MRQKQDNYQEQEQTVNNLGTHTRESRARAPILLATNILKYKPLHKNSGQVAILSNAIWKATAPRKTLISHHTLILFNMPTAKNALAFGNYYKEK